jgi:hypothetical protein
VIAVTPTWIRSVGGVLQIIGVLLVAEEFRRIRSRYPKAPGPLRRGAALVRRRLVFWRRRSARVVVAAADAAVGMDASVHGRVIPGWREDWPIEDKVEALQRGQRSLFDEVDHVQKQVDAEARTRSEQDAARDERVTTEVTRLDDALRDAQTGHIRVRGSGAVFIVVGIFLTSWSSEMAHWLGWHAPHPH